MNEYRNTKEYQKFLKKFGADKKRDKKIQVIDFPNYKYDTRNISPVSNSLGNGYQKDIFQYKWKRGSEESHETIREIENKAKQTAPIYGKGSYQYITPDTDLTKIGKKN